MDFYGLRSRTGFKVFSENGDYSKFINELRNSPVQFFGLELKKDTLFGYVRSRDFSRLCALAEKYRLTVTEFERRGAVVSVKRYRRRIGLPLGFLLSLLIVFLLSDRVMMIEIGGNETIPDSRILSLLRDSGIYIGSRISDVDLRRAEKQIKGMDKEVGWIGIRNTGSRVVVEIAEFTDPPEMERKNTPCNIVAARDAQIKSVRLYSGMLVPMVGDGVKKGDIIVSGTVDTKYGRSFYVHSMGEIIGVYTDKMTFSQPLETTEKLCTHEATKKAVSVFGKRFVYSSEGSTEGEFEYYETEKPLTLGKITFPLSVVEMHYRMLEEISVTRSEEEADRLLEQRISRYEENFFAENAVITYRKLERSVSDGVVTVTASYTLEGEIGVPKQIFAKYEGFEPITEKKAEEK